MSVLPEPQTPRHRNHAMGSRVVCATPSSGKQVSNYTLGDRLGKGAFATVYKGIHLGTANVAAIKQIPLEKIKSVDAVMEEIELLRDLEHPNIVKYLGFMKDEYNLSIVLEYCENGSLAMILHKFGRFPENLVAQYMRQVLVGLTYLHQQGIIHRDIKGANILTTKDGVAKLADFGVAMRIVDATDHSERPLAVGTPHWMAPEIIQMQEPSTACDIWSLAATIVELKTGQPPYGDRQDVTAMYAVVQHDPSAIIPTDASASLRDLLTLCFTKNPDLRISAEELLKHAWITKYGGGGAANGANGAGGIGRGNAALKGDRKEMLNHPERALKAWNSPTRQRNLAVKSYLNLRQGNKDPNQAAAGGLLNRYDTDGEENYEEDFVTLGIFGNAGATQEGRVKKIDRTEMKEMSSPTRVPATPPPKRKNLMDYVETSSNISEYDQDFENQSLQIHRTPKKAVSFNETTKADPFLGLEDLLEDEPDEMILCAQQEASELSTLIVTNRFDLEIGYKRLKELVTSVSAVRKTLDQARIFPKSLTILSQSCEDSRSGSGSGNTSGASKAAIAAFLDLVDSCISIDNSVDFIANFCIAGGLSFVLRQSEIVPRSVLRLLFVMSDFSLDRNEELAIAKQLALREDAIVVVCSFFKEESNYEDLVSASTIIMNMFKACGPRRRANLWHHFNDYGLFVCLVDLLHLPQVLANGANNQLASNLYELLSSFARNPQELVGDTVNHKVLRRLMRAYIKLPIGSPYRGTLLEFFKNTSTLMSVLDAIQRGNVAPHLIAALRRAIHDERISSVEERMTANCLIPTLFNYSRINRYRQREVARYGLIAILQDCVRKFPRLREFAFPIFIALVHADHPECWSALWDAKALASFIDLVKEPGWQATSITALATWLHAQPSEVGPKFIPHISVINETLLSTSGSTFESVLAATTSLLDQNRDMCRHIPVGPLFEALKQHIESDSKNTTSLVQALQIIMWVLTANTKLAFKYLKSQNLLQTLEVLAADRYTPVPCIKLVGQIHKIVRLIDQD